MECCLNDTKTHQTKNEHHIDNGGYRMQGCIFAPGENQGKTYTPGGGVYFLQVKIKVRYTPLEENHLPFLFSVSAGFI